MQSTKNAQTRAWMRLPSGSRLDLIDPDPFGWQDHDLALRLARTYRWGGESCWPQPLSVAQHSLLVLEIRRMLADTPLTPQDELQELLHDAEEGFLGFDCISPLKQILGEPFKSVERRLGSAIWERYEVMPWTEDSLSLHKQADRVAAASEAVHVVGWCPQEVIDVLGITAQVLETDPLLRRWGGQQWAPWAPDVAADRFHETLTRLLYRCRVSAA